MSVRMTFLRATALAGCATASLIVPLNGANAVVAVNGTSTSSLTVQLTVVASCSTVTAAPILNFGNSVTSAQATTAGYTGGGATASLTMTCTEGTTFYIAMGLSGQETGNVTTARNMELAGNKIGYTLNLSASSPVTATAATPGEWGVTHSTDDVSYVSDGTPETLTIAGALTGTTSTNVPVGTYSDTVPITINY